MQHLLPIENWFKKIWLLIFSFVLLLTMVGMMNPKTKKIIFDFHTTASEDMWSTVNDGVMGGVSNSTFTVNLHDSTAIFSGNVSLENNGGFASARTTSGSFQLDNYAGIMLRVKGDGKTYSFRLRTDDNFDGISYRAKFNTEENKWLEIKLPFVEFIPTFRGRILTTAASLKPEKIKQIGFLIADKQEGEFSLIIDWIKAI